MITLQEYRKSTLKSVGTYLRKNRNYKEKNRNLRASRNTFLSDTILYS